MQSSPNSVFYALAAQVGAAYLCHIFGKFACKIKIQKFSYALPLSLAGPATVCLVIPLLLISFRWWENFANTHEAIGMCLTMTISRQYVHMYIYTYIYNSKAHTKLPLNDS